MKKIFLIFSICAALGAITVETKAQAYKMNATNSTSGVDSISCISTTANYLYIKPTAPYKCASFQAVATRRANSMGGTIILQGSNDGSTYTTASENAGDTITVADAATSDGIIKVYPVTGILYQFYRVKCVGASGDTMTVRAWFNGRQ